LNSLRCTGSDRAQVTPDPKRDLGLLLSQVRHEQRSWRKHGSGDLTFVFPLIFLIVASI